MSASKSKKRSNAMDVDDGRAMAEMPLGKQLAHTDKKVRDQAIRNLEAFLSRSDGETHVPLSEKEMAKLWKGLYYCFWMSDKPLVQQGLATDLANLVLRINPSDPDARLAAALAFLEGFWVALVREWNGIDRLRMDKFYMLIRRYVNATFRLLAREEWSEAAINGVNAILIAPRGPMTYTDRSVPSSLATHIADIYLTELDAVLSEDLGPAPVVDILQPHIALLARTPSQVVHKRIISMVITPLLAALSDDDSDEDDERPAKRSKLAGPVPIPQEPLGNIINNALVNGQLSTRPQLRSALVQAMFKAAASPDAVESNRRKMYAVVREHGDDDDE